jgi:hypothetical protein
MASTNTNPDTMSDEEFTQWMNNAEFAEADSEEIEVGPVGDTTEEYEEDEEAVEDDFDDSEEDLEQPEEDSDDNSDEEETEDDVEEDSEEDDEETDGGPEDTDTEQSKDTKDAVKTETQPVVEPAQRTVKAGGEVFQFSDAEMLEQFPAVFAKALDYTQKTQALKKYRPMLDAMEQEKITPEQMNFAIDLLKGNKEAIAKLIKDVGVDTLELEVENEVKYVPQNYGRSNVELDIQEVTAEISKDPEYEVTHTVLTKEWDDESWTEMTKNPNLIRLLHTDIKSGTYQRLSPIAKKIRMQEEMKYGRSMRSDLDYYKAAVVQYTQEQEKAAMRAQTVAVQEAKDKKIADVVKSTEKREVTKAVAGKRRAAAPTKSNAGTRKSIDYLDEALKMSDDDYVKWMEKKL